MAIGASPPSSRSRRPANRTIVTAIVVAATGALLGSWLISGVQTARNAARRATVL